MTVCVKRYIFQTFYKNRQYKMTKSTPIKKNGRKKTANQKSFTIPFDVAVLILGGLLIFIMFILGYRSCTKSDNQLEKLKINIESAVLDSRPEGALL